MFLFHDANKIACLNKGRLSAALASTTLGHLRQQFLVQKKAKGKEKEPLSYIRLFFEIYIYIYSNTYIYI